MAELEIKPDFGIENTLDTAGQGSTELLNDLFAPETQTANPDDVTSIDDDEPKKPATPSTNDDADDEPDDDTARNPDALANFLLGGDDEEEEEEEEEEDPDYSDPPGDDEPAEGDEPADDGQIAFDALANELAELGVFTRDEGEDEIKITSAEEFLDRFNAEKEKGAQTILSEFLQRFGPEHREAFDAIYVKGVNPREYFSQAAKIEDFTNLDLTKESNQESVVRQVLVDQGFDEEDINTEIDKIKNYGDLEDVSKRHHKVLVKKEQKMLKQKEMAAQQAQQIKSAQKEEYVNNVRSVLTEKLKANEFDGIPLNVNTANELQDFLLVDKWKTESGETLTDFDKSILELKRPENHAQKVKVALLLKLLENDPTLSTIQKSGVSKKSSALFKDVARHKTAAKRAASTQKKPAPSWFRK